MLKLQKDWDTTVNIVSPEVIDKVIYNIKTKQVTIDQLVSIYTLVDLLEINPSNSNFDYYDYSFSGTYQQKLLVTFTDKKAKDNIFINTPSRFMNYFNGFFDENNQTVLFNDVKNNRVIAFLPVIVDNVEDVVAFG